MLGVLLLEGSAPKHVLVIMNHGNFKNYGRIMGKGKFGGNVPLWYEKGEYDKIIDYGKRSRSIYAYILYSQAETANDQFT